MPAVTVVVPVYNQLECTRWCLEAVFRHADVPYDLVVVDNGSRDGTAAFLDGLCPASPCLNGWRVVRNAVNAGVARAWNQGLRAAAPGRPVCLLNNDVLVTPGWLRAVLSFLREHPESGIACPHVADGEPPAGYLEAAAAHAVTHRAVVYHLGSRTMSAVAAELGGRDLNLENLRRFTEKWGLRLGNFRVSNSTLITW